MRRLTRFFKRYILGKPDDEHPGMSTEELRAAFTDRYHNFKLLITSNNRCHEIRTDVEKALEGGRSFGMAFIRSRCTAASVNVYRVVKHLDDLAPGKYGDLFARFKDIQLKINDALAPTTYADQGPPVLPLRAIDRDLLDQVGNKMGNVAEIGNKIGLPVPPGFVITAAAYREFMKHRDLKAEINRRIQAAGEDKLDNLTGVSAEIQQMIIQASVPESVETAILDAFSDLETQSGKDVKVSVRSSALGEDAAGSTFAGQFRSILNVSRDTVVQAYKEVVASKYGLPAVTYRLTRGIPHEEVAMCVGCMAMVNAAAGGVMYTSNPLNIRDRSITINSVWGLPKAVVDGSVDPDVFVISREPSFQVIEKRISAKERQYICFPDEGVCRMELTGDKSLDQSLTDDKAVKLAEMALKLEEYYGSPQDIEWAATPEGLIFILQCRPLQQFEVREFEDADSVPKVSGAKVLARGGVTASPGVAAGRIYIVRSDLDKLKCPDGAVLVTAQSLPRWAPLLGKASAMIAEVGGVAGHLANVAREFQVPALFGISDATQLFENGQMVTVDADGLTVYEGTVDSLLSEVTARKNLMEGSPIYEILQRAAEHVVPLTMLDPDSPHFLPANCQTFHDITRFCHEKAVHEMFHFGKEHKFSQRSSKQLVYKVPMQWWIINLDDGFKEEVTGKYVQMENIASIPMHAIWAGTIAVPWEGPPPVDAGGFMSVLVQATANPALEPSTRSAYAARNYFMISKNFCSLSSRFGFHFSTIEALVGERPTENYVAFSFKGGAADKVRRMKRTSFIGGILERYGFRIELKDDSLFSRVEGRDEEYMKSRLRILGYLMMHTRQLDMIMSKDSSVQRYWAKFVREIDGLLCDGGGSGSCET